MDGSDPSLHRVTVRAVQLGRVLVVDEADKAPLEVVTLLKSLLDDGFMLLGDGRRIVSPTQVNTFELWESCPRWR